MSNDHDGVSEDGQEPVLAPSSGEAAEQSAGDGREKPRTAPSSGATEEGAGEDTGATVGGAAAAVSTGPVSAGAARAAARRSAARAGISESKGAATPKRAAATAVKRPNLFARFSRFLREVVAELRKVIWPTKNQMVTYTIVVIAFVAFMVALVGVLDLLFAKGVLAVFG
ncbi:MAG TPA: preprotein translocase subunit SecE [Nakamurella sp.]